jgi:thymidylate synthase (FAD)
MKVQLISTTQDMAGEMTSEELIGRIARVSNPSNENNTETMGGLIAYMIKHRHWSPFEMVDMTVKITTSRAIAAQILRHRSFSFQEFSQRYSEINTIEPLEFRKRSEKNRQSSEEVHPDDAKYRIQFEEIGDLLVTMYSEMVENGIAKECARMILPLATTTTLYMKGSVRSWIHYLQLRCAEDTQLEHRFVANEIKRIFSIQFPRVAKEVFND